MYKKHTTIKTNTKKKIKLKIADFKAIFIGSILVRKWRESALYEIKNATIAARKLKNKLGGKIVL